MATGFKVKQQGSDGIWVSQNGLSTNNWGGQQPNAIIYANGKYTAVGNGGKVATSPDGITWTIQPQLQTTGWGTRNISDIAYGNGLFVIGDGNNAYTATSTDCINWVVSGNLPAMWTTGNGIASLCFGNGKFVITGYDYNKKAYSTNGVNWTNGSGTFSGYALQIIYDSTNSRFVASCSNGYITTSNDGINWVTNTGLNGFDAYWGSTDGYQVRYINSQFVAVGNLGRLATSSDGVNWTYKNGLSSVSNQPFSSLAWDGTRYLTTASYVTNNSYYSTDLNTWSSIESASNLGSQYGGWWKYVILYGGGTYVITGGRTSYSTNFTTWSAFQNLSDCYDGNWNGSQFILVGSGGACYTSPDGATWTSRTSYATAMASNSGNSVVWNGSKYVSGGVSGYIATSTDGITWTQQTGLRSTSWGTSTVNDITWSGTQFVAVGDSGKVATSSDGVTWTYQSGLSSTGWGTEIVYSVAYGNSKYVAIGSKGSFAYSSDAVTWTNIGPTVNGSNSTFGYNNANGIVWDSANTRYVVVGDKGRAATSANANTWVYQSGFNSSWGSTYNANAIVADGSRYIAVGANGQAATSTDGATWTLQSGLASTTFGTNTAIALLSNAGTTIVAGGTGQVATSTDGATWTYQGGVLSSGWTGPNAVNASNYNGMQYLVVGDTANIARSYDRINWYTDSNLKTTSWGSTDSVNTIAWNGTQYVVGGASGKIATSPDGITWTYQGGLASTTWSTTAVSEIIWNGSKFVAVGSGGKVATSTDGVTWVYSTNVSNNVNFRSIAYRNGIHVASSNFFTDVYTSTDAVTWTQRSITYSGTYITRVRWCKDRFVIIGYNGYASYSYDGITWVSWSSLQAAYTTSYQMYDMGYDGERFIVVGDNRYAQSYDGITWTAYAIASGSLTLAINGFDYLVGGSSASLQISTNNYQVDLDDLLVRRDAFSAGNAYTWGSNNYSQLGDGATTSKSSPGTVSGNLNSWKQIAVGAFTVKAVKTDGTLWGWGYNVYGDLGDGTNIQRNSPVTVSGGGNNWKQVASSEKSTAAIKTDGTLWTYGDNDNGTLGDGTVSPRSSPVTTVGGGNNWKTLCANGTYGTHLAAIKTDGTLWTWGSNGAGQLGDNTITNKSSPVTTAGGGNNWNSVSVGWASTAAIKTDGTLWTWGHNGSGRLGDGTTTSRSSPVSIAGGGSNWKQVACGYSHMAAVKTDGTLWTWGVGSSGQLGHNTSSNRSSPGTVSGGGTNWKQVSCGVGYTAAVKTDGTLWAFGGAGNGKLGDNSVVAKSSPVQVAGGFTNWKQVSCGYNTTAAITDLSL